LTGKADSEVGDRKREAELKEGKVDGDTISFVEMLSLQDNEIRITYVGKRSAEGNEIKFTREVGDFAKGEIVAKREQSAPDAKAIRIKAGRSEPVKDAEDNVWLADQGFEGGQTIERPDIQIANTKSPDLYRAERYGMDSFSWPVPNGKYVVKPHFAETYEGINGPGERVFSFNVQVQPGNPESKARFGSRMSRSFHRPTIIVRTARARTSCNCWRTCSRNSCASPAAIILNWDQERRRFRAARS